MRIYNPATFTGMVIFKKNNPNFIITNTNEEIEEMFKNKNVPVLVGDNEIIGFVKDVEFWSNDDLIGDIFVWDQESFYPVFKNYEVEVDENRKILRVDCVEFDKKPIIS